MMQRAFTHVDMFVFICLSSSILIGQSMHSLYAKQRYVEYHNRIENTQTENRTLIEYEAFAAINAVYVEDTDPQGSKTDPL